MSERDVFSVIRRPLLTERTTWLRDQRNQYAFEVIPEATKGDIKRAVQEVFKVKVDRVRTMIVFGKVRRMGRSQGRRPDWKKALVTLKPGQKIELVPEVS